MYVETVRAPIVRAFPVLQKLNEATLSSLCLAIEKREVAPRTVLVHFGEKMKELIFLTSGNCLIITDTSSSSSSSSQEGLPNIKQETTAAEGEKNRVMTMTGKSTIFGLEIFATMHDIPSTIKVSALGACKCFALPLSHPSLAYLRSERDVVMVIFKINIYFCFSKTKKT